MGVARKVRGRERGEQGKAPHVGCGLGYKLHQSGLDIRVTYVHGEAAPRVATQSSRAWARFEVWAISYLTMPLITLYSPLDVPRTLIKHPWMCGGGGEGGEGGRGFQDPATLTAVARGLRVGLQAPPKHMRHLGNAHAWENRSQGRYAVRSSPGKMFES